MNKEEFFQFIFQASEAPRPARWLAFLAAIPRHWTGGRGENSAIPLPAERLRLLLLPLPTDHPPPPHWQVLLPAFTDFSFHAKVLTTTGLDDLCHVQIQARRYAGGGGRA